MEDFGRLIDEPRFKPLVEAVEIIINRDGIKEDYIIPGTNKDSVIADAVREIVSNVAEFDNWWFSMVDENGFLDLRKERLLLIGSAKDEPGLEDIIRKNVEYTLGLMRAAEELEIEPDVGSLVGDLVRYVTNWQDWYYDYKAQRDRLIWSENIGEGLDIYQGDYGDDESQGSSIYYDEDSRPFIGKPDNDNPLFPEG